MEWLIGVGISTGYQYGKGCRFKSVKVEPSQTESSADPASLSKS